MNAPFRRRSRRGFTLIELMIVVGVIGLLAAIAIPNYRDFQRRARSAERTAVLGGIEKAIKNYVAHADKGATAATTVVVSGGWNPPLPRTARRTAWVKTVAGWSTLDFDPQGADLAYSYSFVITTTSSGASYDLYATGDIDGNGVQSVRTIHADISKGGHWNTTSDVMSGDIW